MFSLPLLLLACSRGEPLAVTVAPTDPADTPDAVAEVVRRRLKIADAKVLSLDVEGDRVRVEARIPKGAREATIAGLERAGRLELRPVDDAAAAEVLTAHTLPPPIRVETVRGLVRACSTDAAALKDALAALPVPDRAWTTERDPELGACALLLEPPLEGIEVADASLRLGKELGVNVVLTEDAAPRFAEATKGLVGRRVAAVVDGEAVSAPRVAEAVVGGRILLSLPPSHDPSVTDARAIATALGGGALHGPLHVEAQEPAR